MLKLQLPQLNYLEAGIRAIGASTLPTSNNFWFEDVAQLPGHIKQEFSVSTDYPGIVHELWVGIDDDLKLLKVFTPAESLTTLVVNLQPGLYNYVLKNEKDKNQGSFQVSIKELVWWTWIQQLVPYFQDLTALESRLNNPFYLFFYEISLPSTLLQLNSSPYGIRCYAQSSNRTSISKNFLSFAMGVFDTPVKKLSYKSQVEELVQIFSYQVVPYISPIMSRRGAFLALSNVVDTSRDFALIQEHSEASVYKLSMDFSGSLKIVNDETEFADILYEQITENFIFEIVDQTNTVVATLDSKDNFTFINGKLTIYYSKRLDKGYYWLRCNYYKSSAGVVHGIAYKYEAITPIYFKILPGLTTTINLVWTKKKTWVYVRAPLFVIWTLTRNSIPVVTMAGTTLEGIILPDDGNYPCEINVTPHPLAEWLLTPPVTLIIQEKSTTRINIEAQHREIAKIFEMSIIEPELSTIFNFQLIPPTINILEESPGVTPAILS